MQGIKSDKANNYEEKPTHSKMPILALLIYFFVMTDWKKKELMAGFKT